jgi:hypothetical protein
MRTYNEILQSIIDKKTATSELDELDSSSQTSVWLALAHVFASIIYIFELIVAEDKAEVEQLVRREKYGFIDWYSNEALSFQLGDSLVFDDETGILAYTEIDEDKQIIAKASTSENEITAQIKLKVAKSSGSDLVPLIQSELDLFKAYMKAVKVGGTNLLVLSEPADVVMLDGNVLFNPQYDVDELKSNINDALNAFKLNFSYNGILRRNDIIQEVRKVAGVIDFVPSQIQVKKYDDSYSELSSEYETFSGYFNYSNSSPADNFTYETN